MPVKLNVLILYRVAVDASPRRRDPVGKLARLGHLNHDAFDVIAICLRAEPFALARFEGFFVDQLAGGIKEVTRIFALVAMKFAVRKRELISNSCLFSRPVP